MASFRGRRTRSGMRRRVRQRPHRSSRGAGADAAPKLGPIRYGRMLVSPFTFFRGGRLPHGGGSREWASDRIARPALRRRAPLELRHLRRSGSWKRRAVHRALADAVTDLEERARHLALAAEGPDAVVASYLEAAAEQAVARGAPSAAGELYELPLSSRRAIPPWRSVGAFELHSATALQANRAGGRAPRPAAHRASARRRARRRSLRAGSDLARRPADDHRGLERGAFGS